MLLASMSQVQAARAEDLMDIYALALENDPVFQGETYRHEASPELYRQARSELLPRIGLDYYYSNNNEKLNDTDISVYGEDNVSYSSNGYSLTLTQPIFDYSSIMRLKKAKEELKGADLELESARQELIIRVAEAYIGALKARDTLKYSKAEEEALSRHFELAKERYSNGLSSITDFHDAKASLAAASARRVMAENEYDDAMEALAVISGKSVSDITGLKTSGISGYLGVSSAAAELLGESGLKGMEMPLINPEPDNLGQWEEAASTQNLDVKVKEQDLASAEKEISVQKAGHMPTLSLEGSMNRDKEGGSLYGGESDLATREVMVKLNIPIFEGLSVNSRVREARRLAQAAKQDLERSEREAKRDARAAFLGIKGAISNTEALLESMISYQIALESKKEGFKSGLYPSLSVVDAERDLYSARKDYSSSQYEYIINSLQLKKAAGIIGREDLEWINGWLESE